jgi:hypothetical protein
LVGAGEQLCIEGSSCCALGEEPKKVGMIQKDGMICMLGLFCCELGLKVGVW